MKKTDDMGSDFVLVKEIWNLLGKIDFDQKERIIASIYRKIFSEKTKQCSFSHKEAVFPPKIAKVFCNENKTDYFFCDHPGKMAIFEATEKAINKKILYTFEPYGIDMDSLEKLIQICKDNRYSFFISGDSPHFVGRTVMIKIAKLK
jgi:hypothetical protein